MYNSVLLVVCSDLIEASYGVRFIVFKLKTRYGVRISGWSSDVCSSDLAADGKVFSAGGDIVKRQKKIDDPALFYRGIANSRRLVFAALDCPKPTIAKINGDAVGLGATLALMCDFVIATDEAKILDPHVNVGLVAGDGGAFIWPHLIDRKSTRLKSSH